MSTKIYNGWLCPSNNLGAEAERLHRLRPSVQAAADTVIAQWFANRATSLIDEAWHAGTSATDVLTAVRREQRAREEHVRTMGGKDPVLDTTCSVVIIPVEDKVLACVFGPNTTMIAAATAGMVYFPYWDNTDPPEGMDASTWGEHERLWTLAMNRDPASRPAACGPIVEFVSSPIGPDLATILAHVPSREKRAAQLARTILVHERITPIEHTLSTGDVATLMMDDAFQHAIAATTHDLGHRLPAITKAMLAA